MLKKLESVECSSILIVEGKDEVSFLDAYIYRHKGLEKSKVQIIDAGGKYGFRQDLADLKDLPGFDSVRRIAIIRDADLSAEQAFQSVSNALQSESLPVPDRPGHFATDETGMITVGIFVTPDNKRSGCLESLLVDIIKSRNLRSCVDEFFKCADKPSRPKQYMLALLSLMEEYCNSIGLAAQKGYFDFTIFDNSEMASFVTTFLQI